jgi:RNA polymerase sigma-70 factor, ECF subfamily
MPQPEPSDVEETRRSLLLRVKDIYDQESWRQFVVAYSPIMRRYLHSVGVEAQDAEDVTQEVLESLLRRLPGFDYQPSKGKFRSWLYAVTTNQARRYMRRQRRRVRGTGGTTACSRLLEMPDARAQRHDAWDQQWKQRAFEVACTRVRPQVQPQTWEAFELTAVKSVPPEEAAKRLKISVGQVYVCKSRVLKRLQAAAAEFDG